MLQRLEPPLVIGSWGLQPQTPCCDTSTYRYSFIELFLDLNIFYPLNRQQVIYFCFFCDFSHQTLQFLLVGPQKCFQDTLPMPLLLNLPDKTLLRPNISTFVKEFQINMENLKKETRFLCD